MVIKTMLVAGSVLTAVMATAAAPAYAMKPQQPGQSRGHSELRSSLRGDGDGAFRRHRRHDIDGDVLARTRHARADIFGRRHRHGGFDFGRRHHDGASAEIFDFGRRHRHGGADELD